MIQKSRQYWEEASFFKRLMTICALIVALGAAGGTLLGVKSWAQGRVDAFIIERIDSSMFNDSLKQFSGRLSVLERDSLRKSDVDSLEEKLERQFDELRLALAKTASSQETIIQMLRAR